MTIPTIKRWDTHPDRESLRVIHRFLSQREKTENVSLEPRRTHPRLVRATVDDESSPTASGVLKIRWYETGDFVITYQTDQMGSTSSVLQWIHPPDTEEIKVSQSGSDDVQRLTPPSHHPDRNRSHPLRVLPLVLATIEECTKESVSGTE